MLVTGLIITVIGMATVFAFLSIMVWVIDIAGRVIQAIEKRRPQEQPVVSEITGAVPDEEIAAVIAAIHAL